MTTRIPEIVARTDVHARLVGRGFRRIHQGKVRDTYEHASLVDERLLLVVATDRVSTFDFVLPCTVPGKGELLTAMTVFWLDEVLGGGSCNHHLVAYGDAIDQYLPSQARGDVELQKRALVVRKLEMLPVECIVRGYLTGSGWKSYQETGQLAKCSVKLPTGLHDGSKIGPIFNPTTKAHTGHDEALADTHVTNTYGDWTRSMSLDLYTTLASVAKDSGLIMADTKFEFGMDRTLADEVGTPDSSRFWDHDQWTQACELEKSPSPYDKEMVRNWGKEVRHSRHWHESGKGIQHLKPENNAHVAFVHSRVVPDGILMETSRRYEVVLGRLTGLTRAEFQQKKMGIAA